MRFMLGTAVTVLTGLLSSSLANAQTGQTADNFIGTWKLNVAKSKYSPGPGPKELTVTFERVATGVKITAKGVAGDGTPINTSHTATYDGKDVPVTGALDFDSSALTMMDANTRHTVRKKGGKEVQTLHSVLAKDGKSYTTTTTGVNAKGEKIQNTSVFDKQ